MTHFSLHERDFDESEMLFFSNETTLMNDEFTNGMDYFCEDSCQMLIYVDYV